LFQDAEAAGILGQPNQAAQGRDDWAVRKYLTTKRALKSGKWLISRSDAEAAGLSIKNQAICLPITLTSQRFSSIVPQLDGGIPMKLQTKRATVYLDPALHQALRLQAVETSRSVSDLINEAIRDELAEDAADLAQFEERKNEPTLGFEDFLKKLRLDGTI
jgi:post-segregation antitoxin (ccd killing protein)